jgi:hypothetical protein
MEFTRVESFVGVNVCTFFYIRFEGVNKSSLGSM